MDCSEINLQPLDSIFHELTPLHIAVREGREHDVRFLCSYASDTELVADNYSVNCYGCTPLRYAFDIICFWKNNCYPIDIGSRLKTAIEILKRSTCRSEGILEEYRRLEASQSLIEGIVLQRHRFPETEIWLDQLPSHGLMYINQTRLCPVS